MVRGPNAFIKYLAELGVNEGSATRILQTLNRLTKGPEPQRKSYPVGHSDGIYVELSTVNGKGMVTVHSEDNGESRTYRLWDLEITPPKRSFEQVKGIVKDKIGMMLNQLDYGDHNVVTTDAVPALGTPGRYDAVLGIADPAGQTSQSIIGTATVVCKQRRVEIHIAPTTEEAERHAGLEMLGYYNYHEEIGSGV